MTFWGTTFIYQTILFEFIQVTPCQKREI